MPKNIRVRPPWSSQTTSPCHSLWHVNYYSWQCLWCWWHRVFYGFTHSKATLKQRWFHDNMESNTSSHTTHVTYHGLICNQPMVIREINQAHWCMLSLSVSISPLSPPFLPSHSSYHSNLSSLFLFFIFMRPIGLCFFCPPCCVYQRNKSELA